MSKFKSPAKKKSPNKLTNYKVLDFKNEVKNQSMRADSFGYGKAKERGNLRLHMK